MPQSKLNIPVFYGTYANLTKLDLSFMNGTLMFYRGKKFRNFFKMVLAEDDFDYAYAQITMDPEHHHIYENNKIKRYAIVPEDINKPFLQEQCQHFYQLMLSIYPSDFALIQVLHLTAYENKYQDSGSSYYNFRHTGKSPFDNFMFISKYEYRFVRTYLKTYFDSSYSLKYLKYMLTVFSHSFLETSPIYQYLSMMICLEVTVDGREQVIYRLKRNVALLCGDSISTCQLIYKNIDQLYKLRSAIVHGQVNPSYKNLTVYHDYLKGLVARLIRELIVHNVPTITKLNEMLTSLGYGQNHLISDSYVPSKYPIVANIVLLYREI